MGSTGELTDAPGSASAELPTPPAWVGDLLAADPRLIWRDGLLLLDAPLSADDLASLQTDPCCRASIHGLPG